MIFFGAPHRKCEGHFWQVQWVFSVFAWKKNKKKTMQLHLKACELQYITLLFWSFIILKACSVSDQTHEKNELRNYTRASSTYLHNYFSSMDLLCHCFNNANYNVLQSFSFWVVMQNKAFSFLCISAPKWWSTHTWINGTKMIMQSI